MKVIKEHRIGTLQRVPRTSEEILSRTGIGRRRFRAIMSCPLLTFAKSTCLNEVGEAFAEKDLKDAENSELKTYENRVRELGKIVQHAECPAPLQRDRLLSRILGALGTPAICGLFSFQQLRFRGTRYAGHLRPVQFPKSECSRYCLFNFTETA